MPCGRYRLTTGLAILTRGLTKAKKPGESGQKNTSKSDILSLLGSLFHLRDTANIGPVRTPDVPPKMLYKIQTT